MKKGGTGAGRRLLETMTAQVKVYKGKEIEGILRKIQLEYEDYKILDQKTIRKFPFIFLKEYEVKILIEGAKQPPKEEEKIHPVFEKSPEDQSRKKMILDILNSTKSTSGKSGEVTDSSGPQVPAQEPANQQEFEDMKQMMQKMMRQLDEKQEEKPQGYLIQEKEKNLKICYDRLLASEMKPETAKEMMEEVKQILTYEGYDDLQEVEETLLKVLQSELPVVGSFDKSGIETIALIGATGVGKTTTIAKIASILKHNRNKKIGLISTDVYRIAAIEQLETYANILETKMKPVSSPQELKSAIDYFKNVIKVDKILIDTVGRNTMLEDSVEDIKSYLEAAQPDHVSFVLSSTQKSSDMQRVLDNFESVDLNSVIFTKLDETLSYGFMVDVLKNRNIGVSYVTNGQNVPKDIYTASSEKLAKQVLSGVDQFGSSDGIA